MEQSMLVKIIFKIPLLAILSVGCVDKFVREEPRRVKVTQTKLTAPKVTRTKLTAPTERDIAWKYSYRKDKYGDPDKTKPYVFNVQHDISCYGSVEVSYDDSKIMFIYIDKVDKTHFAASIRGDLAITFAHAEYTSHRGYGGFTTVSLKDSSGQEYRFKGDRSWGTISFADYHIKAKNDYYNADGTSRPMLLAILLAREQPLKIHISAASTISATCSGTINPIGARVGMKKMGIRTKRDFKKFNISNHKKR